MKRYHRIMVAKPDKVFSAPLSQVALKKGDEEHEKTGCGHFRDSGRCYPISRSICLITVNESDSVYLGGNQSNQGKIVIKIFTFDNAFTEDAKEKLYSQITDVIIEEHQETKKVNGNNVWCILLPISAGNFGVGGKPVSLDITRKIVSSYRNA